MSTVAEILEAVRRLPPEQKLELVQELDAVLFEPSGQESGAKADYLSPEFTARLMEHFQRAKRAALSRS